MTTFTRRELRQHAAKTVNGPEELLPQSLLTFLRTEGRENLTISAIAFCFCPNNEQWQTHSIYFKLLFSPISHLISTRYMHSSFSYFILIAWCHDDKMSQILSHVKNLTCYINKIRIRMRPSSLRRFLTVWFYTKFEVRNGVCSHAPIGSKQQHYKKKVVHEVVSNSSYGTKFINALTQWHLKKFMSNIR